MDSYFLALFKAGFDSMMEQLAKKRGTSFDEAIESFLKNKPPNIVVDRRGKANEVAPVIAFLCTEHASYITGSNYRVDGGFNSNSFWINPFVFIRGFMQRNRMY